LWYTVATGGVGSATAPTTSTATAGTTSYWVSQVGSAPTNCEGPRSKIDVIVVALPLAPAVTSPINYCLNATSVPLTATATAGNTLRKNAVERNRVGYATETTRSTATAG